MMNFLTSYSAVARLHAQDFMRQTGYPMGRRGCVADHIVPLECGGGDVLQICNGKQSRKRRSKTEAKETAGGSRIRSVNKRVQQMELKIKWLDEPEA